MKILLDTNFLYALNDLRDDNHKRSVDFLSNLTTASLFLPSPVLPELCYLLHSRLGHLAMRNFLTGLVDSDIELVPVDVADLPRVNKILAQYADARLDFADASIIAMAERLGITRILTFDRRDYSIVHPRHCNAFELLP
ncbi:MAG TPA: PIN domain-containing protein [Chloroflexi bacterium]|nr:PIN domain-containing protein [Chloroflexota bacterium]